MLSFYVHYVCNDTTINSLYVETYFSINPIQSLIWDFFLNTNNFVWEDMHLNKWHELELKNQL